MRHKFFDAKVQAPDTEPVEARIRDAVAAIADARGLPPEEVGQLLQQDLDRRVAKAHFDSLKTQGIDIRGLDVLDDGTGVGTLAVEAAVRGARITAIEPGPGYYEIVRDRLAGFPDARALEADGEALPFPDATFDVVTSIQVLEHVMHPRKYLEEAFRVLRPGGVLYLSAENYLAFYEAHYRIFWLPLMPKWLGTLYLKARRRPTAFLRESITYVTRPGVARMLRQVGFVRVHRPRKIERLGLTTFSAGLFALVRKP
jgi:ubiquinone/menaquinone biosynthesis C-methylase UbiE